MAFQRVGTIRVYDHATGTIVDLGFGLRFSPPLFDGGVLAFDSYEGFVIYDASRNELINTGLHAFGAALVANNHVVFLPLETDVDLNGDGDTLDFVLHVAKVLTPTEQIADVIEAVADLNLAQGISNTLDAKLDSALNALQDVNENNNVAACGSMQSFINSVEAQRNKKITSAQADELIAAAQQIMTALGCAP